MRRSLTIPILAGFVSLATGLPLALHLHLWHQEHGDESRHDPDTCPVFQAVIATAKAVVSGTAALLVDAHPWYRSGGTLPQTPEITHVPLPIAPRAPPLT